MIEDEKDYPVSFNGKTKFTLTLSLSLEKKEIEEIVLNDKKTINFLKVKTLKKVIVVHGKIINIVC